MARRVLITGARAAAALDLARDFAAEGWEAHCADSSGARIARWSRVPAGVHRYAPPALDRTGFRRDMSALLDRLTPELVVPTCEEVFHLAAWREAEGSPMPLFAPRFPLLRQLHDKLLFARLCAEHGLGAPESAPLDPHQPPADPHHWVFKSRFTRFGDGLLLGPSPEMLDQRLSAMREGWMAQRLVRGQEVSFYAVAREGSLLAFAAYRSDWRLGGGASFAFDPVAPALADSLRDIATTLARATGLTGQFSCDAIIDAAGQPWLIECNPRATSGVHLLAGSGALARAIGDGAAALGIAPRAAFIGPAMFTYGLPAALRSGDWRGWLRTLRMGRDATGRRGDRGPALGALADGLAFTVQGWRHGMSATAATTREIEWNGEDIA